MGVLYISYDGVADNLGQSQIIPYILGLSKKDIAFTLLTFEKESAFRNKDIIESIRSRLNNNIDWIFLKYHKRPSLIVTLYDIIHGFFIGLWVVKKKKIKIIHGRTFIGSIIALLLKKILKVYVILDIRGFWPEEKVEAGLWNKDSLLYRIAKRIEQSLILNADEIATLTLNGKKEIEGREYLRNKKINVNVIPTCVDLDRFKFRETNDIKIAMDKNIEGKFILIYIGSLSTWYMQDEMFKFFEVLQSMINNAHFLILTKDDKFLRNTLQKEKMNVSIVSVEHNLVPQYLSIAKIGLAFYKPGYSRKACCPTKIGEYLAVGLPVIINTGIGDCDEIIFKEKVGVVINEFSVQEYGRAVHELLELLSEEDRLRERCKAVAKKYFSLEIGINRYLDIYRRLMMG